MKQLIGLGTVVDDGTGDYLRKGGQKTNDNFNELYTKLGDGTIPHPAGAWKTVTAAEVNPIFGDSFALNTTDNTITVNLPKGTVNDYNKVIRLRDVWQSWATKSVLLKAAAGDTIKGETTPVRLSVNYMDVELVYCSPGRWSYIENKTVDKITNSDLASVMKKEYIATQDQTDFKDIFGIGSYNIDNIEVYLRGNLLYYGQSLTADSNYGSIDPTDPADVIPLDGKTIRLRIKCNEGDTVAIVTHLDGAAPWRSTYNRKQIRLYDESLTNSTSVPGSRVVADLATKTRITVEELGLSQIDSVNPNSLEVIVNGIDLVRVGDADYPEFICEGFDQQPIDQETCERNGGAWKASIQDYQLEFNDKSNLVAINFETPFEDGDTLVIKWYNNDIGTLMTWEGETGIKSLTDALYLNSAEIIATKNIIEYTDYDNPSQKTMSPVAPQPPRRAENISDMFDLFHPIGTIYTNAHNPANPKDYMGFGTWVRYKEAEGRAIVGWDSSDTAPTFRLNNNDLDPEGRPKATSGGTYGDLTTTIETNNIPELATDEEVLVKDDNGTVIIGGCQYDPDETGPGYKKYTEKQAHINEGKTAVPMNNIQPSVTVHIWLRVA